MLDVQRVSLELIEALAPIVERIRRNNPDLVRQIVRSASSIALNIGEGLAQRGGSARVRFETAAGSARETQMALKVAVAWGWVAEQGLTEALDLLDRLLAMLWRLRG